MQLADIVSQAEYQRDNWVFADGMITSVDLATNTVTLNGSEQQTFTMNDNALKQLVDRLKIRGTIKEFSTDREFQQKALDNKLNLRDKDNRIIYDVNTNNAKAIMTPKYKILENSKVLEMALNKGYENYFDPKYSYIDDRRVNLAFSGIKEFKVEGKKRAVGDILSMGSQVWNSQSGGGSVGVGQILIRLACTNGMTSKDKLFVRTNKHANHIDLQTELLKDMNEILDPTKMAKLISRAIDRPARLPLLTDKEDEEQIKPWAKLLSRFGVPGIHHDGIFDAHLTENVGVSEHGVNGWGIVNAVTRYNSHDYMNQPAFMRKTSEELMSATLPMLNM